MGLTHKKNDGNWNAITAAVNELYAEGQTDYSFEPIVIDNPKGHPVGCIKDGDAVIFCCRRGEREIQLTEAFTDPDFDKFPREPFRQLDFVILTLYHEKFKDLPIAFAPTRVPHTLGEIVSSAGLRQLRVSESEKFAHITFFLNGGRNEPFPSEEDIRVPSIKGIPFEKSPELSLAQVATQVINGIESRFDLIVTNFANGDVIGHTSSTEAKIQCARFIDKHLGDVVEAAIHSDYIVLVTADHGNLEELVTKEGDAHVSHTSNPVPFILIDPRNSKTINLRDGNLADIAPTILQLLNIRKPKEMTGRSLLSAPFLDKNRRVLLIILDGWGISSRPENDPIAIAETPNWDRFQKEYSHSTLFASGEAVGLKAGKAGNSEAGHMNIGAGRIVLQDDVRLSQAMKDGSFYQNEIILNTLRKIKESGKSLHLIGLLTEKSSHGSIDYPLAILKMAKEMEIHQAFLHMIFDGRSTEPGSAPQLLEKFQLLVDEIGSGTIASGMGRGIALDRDGNYAKTQKAYNALVFGIGKRAAA